MSKQDILVTIGDAVITEADVDAFIANLPKEQQMYASNPQFRKQCEEQIISIHLYAKLGEELKLQETEQFQSIMANARRDILAQLAMAETLKDVTVTEDEVSSYYNENGNQFSKGETVNAKHILVAEEEKCSEILESIVSGKTEFEAAAKEFSTCPSGAQGGDLGEFGRGQMVPEFEQAAFEAEIGHVVGPVKTQFGYHLIKVEKRTEAQVLPFDQVKDKIKMNLLQQKQNQVYLEKAEELRGKYVK
ncbi:MAG: peptidylprolyl isomerase [Lachnospiraceae bacterium]|nr:peptidylprolyl isomerase [Lachnospiraceae bacterium]